MGENIFQKLPERSGLKIVTILLGIITGVMTIYSFFLPNKKIDLRYEIIANTNVLDFNADINKLEVYYDSTNLKQTQENLRIYTVKIINNGKQDIVKGDYDDNAPLGIQINSGEIIEQPQLIQTSNDYIKHNLNFIDYQKDRISFSQVILEASEYYIVKLLVLHKKDTIPEIISFGKIAGQKNIDVVNAIDVKEEVTFWGRVFFGNIWVQVLKLLIYLAAWIIIIIVIVGIASSIGTYQEKKRKIKVVDEFKKLEMYEYTRMDNAIFDRYKEWGPSSFKKMRTLLDRDEKELNETYKRSKDNLKGEYRYRQHGKSDDFYIISEMIKDGIVVFREQDHLVVNQAMKDTLYKFMDFLKTKKEDFYERPSSPIFETETISDDQ
ncbi:hypothetical protein EZS27_011785 [termite gut metagenome]|uniref:DUF5305 domain-containing protein n=1 Tax=termite gut metagenome TaxID=433724 RepID=A0A5J4S4B8_9ZZZZ